MLDKLMFCRFGSNLSVYIDAFLVSERLSPTFCIFTKPLIGTPAIASVLKFMLEFRIGPLGLNAGIIEILTSFVFKLFENLYPPAGTG